MKKHTNTLLGVVAIVGMSASSSAFADSIHQALDKSPVSSEMVELKATTGKSKSTSWTINDYVKKYRGLSKRRTA